jgi:hypothetical protein
VCDNCKRQQQQTRAAAVESVGPRYINVTSVAVFLLKRLQHAAGASTYNDADADDDEQQQAEAAVVKFGRNVTVKKAIAMIRSSKLFAAVVSRLTMVWRTASAQTILTEKLIYHMLHSDMLAARFVVNHSGWTHMYLTWTHKAAAVLQGTDVVVMRV